MENTTASFIARFMQPTGKTVNVKPVKTAVSDTTLSVAFHVRQVMALVETGNADKAIALLNSDKFRPIHVISFLLGRKLTQEEIARYWNQAEEYSGDIKTAVSVSRRWQDTNAALRRSLRENNIAGKLDVKADSTQDILNDLRKFAEKLESVRA